MFSRIGFLTHCATPRRIAPPRDCGLPKSTVQPQLRPDSETAYYLCRNCGYIKRLLLPQLRLNHSLCPGAATPFTSGKLRWVSLKTNIENAFVVPPSVSSKILFIHDANVSPHSFP